MQIKQTNKVIDQGDTCFYNYDKFDLQPIRWTCSAFRKYVYTVANKI